MIADLEDDAGRPDQHRHGEDPEEETVQDHGHILPVLEDLSRKNSITTSTSLRRFTFNF